MSWHPDKKSYSFPFLESIHNEDRHNDIQHDLENMNLPKVNLFENSQAHENIDTTAFIRDHLRRKQAEADRDDEQFNVYKTLFAHTQVLAP